MEKKFRYVLKSKSTGKIHYKWYYLKQVESGLNNLFDVENYEIILRDQYIGRKDTNGTEIYEGDIAKAGIYVGEHQITKIEYIGTAFVMDYPEDDVDYFIISGFPGTIEIIGNIHENPELLEGKE